MDSTVMANRKGTVLAGLRMVMNTMDVTNRAIHRDVVRSGVLPLVLSQTDTGGTENSMDRPIIDPSVGTFCSPISWDGVWARSA